MKHIGFITSLYRLYWFIHYFLRIAVNYQNGVKYAPCREGNAYLNFISSHDGIGMRPVEGILNESDLKKFFNRIKKMMGLFLIEK